MCVWELIWETNSSGKLKLDPQRPFYNSGKFKQTRGQNLAFKDFHNQQKLPGKVRPIIPVLQ